jgi:hypothetical protein
MLSPAPIIVFGESKAVTSFYVPPLGETLETQTVFHTI